eukprot:m.55515 g.55515  ORF g.55515 m.55515 type:complete len:211 (-) comp22089_c0_seq1:166-798(-)
MNEITSLPTVGTTTHKEENVQACFADTNLDTASSGTLYITEEHIVWWSETAQKGFQVEYPALALHAIQTDTNNFPKPCIYCQLDTSGDADEPASELRLVPQQGENLSSMFNALCQCQALHPDPDSQSDEDMGNYDDAEEDDENEFEDADEDEDEAVTNILEGADVPYYNVNTDPSQVHLTPEGQATLDRLAGMLISTSDAFDDNETPQTE